MQKIISFTHLSLDGYANGPQGELAWVNQAPEVAEDVDGRLREVGTVVYGRITYGMMAGYWPTVPANPESTLRELEHARWVEDLPKVVISRSLERADWHHTTLIRDHLVEALRAQKQRSSGPLMVFGSPQLVQVLESLGLIDEYLIYLNPVTLGGGTPLFETAVQQSKLTLLEAKPFVSGVIGLRYATTKGQP
ncbi:dihydrofolate reductase family protein [Deinococcus sp. UYEF24]